MSYPQTRRSGRARLDLFTALAFIGAGAIIAGLPQAQQAAIASAVRSTVLFPFLELHRAFAQRSDLRQRYTELRAERDSLALAALEARRLADQASRLRRFLNLEELSTGRFLPADLYPGRPRLGDSDVFILRTPRSGVLEPPVGVFTGRGLLGVVRGSGPGGALGEFWSHPDFRVSVRTADGAINGIVYPLLREDGQPLMLLQGAPYQEEIEPGTALLTTGLAGLYPPGILVGTVREVEGTESGWMKRYVVEPAVRPGETDAVLVWLRSAMERPVAAGDGGAAESAGPPEGAGAPAAGPDESADSTESGGATPDEEAS